MVVKDGIYANLNVVQRYAPFIIDNHRIACAIKCMYFLQ